MGSFYEEELLEICFNTSNVSVEYVFVVKKEKDLGGFNTSNVSVEWWEASNSFRCRTVSILQMYRLNIQPNPQSQFQIDVSILQMYRLNVDDYLYISDEA